MRIHHLNTGTLCPLGEKLVSGEGGFGTARVVCHALLIEAGDQLVLVETGLGTEDAAHPYSEELFCAHDPVDLDRFG